jgi:hypothetical protein
MNNNLPIEYDEIITEKIRKMIETGIRKLKSFVNSRKFKFKQYSELKEKFLEIAASLEKYDFLTMKLTISYQSRKIYCI